MIARYSKKFPYAPFLNEDIGYEKSIPDNATEEEMIQASLQLNRVATEVHRRLNPHLNLGVSGVASFDVPYGPPSYPYPQDSQIQKKEPEPKIGVTPEIILSSPDLNTLLTYKFIVKGKPDLQEAYDKRMNEVNKLSKKKNGKIILP